MNYRTANSIANNGESSRRNNTEGMEAIGSVIERVLIGLAEKCKHNEGEDESDGHCEDIDCDDCEYYDVCEETKCERCEEHRCEDCTHFCCLEDGYYEDDFDEDELEDEFEDFMTDYPRYLAAKKRRKIIRAMLIAAGAVTSAAALCAGASALAKRYGSGKTVSADKRTFPLFNRGDGNG